MKKQLCTLILSTIAFAGVSQDNSYVTSHSSLVGLNPSFAGTNGLVRSQFSYRNQWPWLSGSYASYGNNTDVYLSKIRGGLAASAAFEEYAYGIFKGSFYSLAYAQHLSFREGTLKIIPSLQLGYGIKELSSYWIVPNPHTPSQPKRIKREYADLGSGLLVNYKDLYIGVSAAHLNHPEVGVGVPYKQSVRYVTHVSYNFHAGSTLLNFSGMIASQRAFTQMKVAVNAVFVKRLIAGASYLAGDALGFNLGFRGDVFTVQAGYDVTYSRLFPRAAGAWELHGSYNLRNKEQRRQLVNFEAW